MPYIWSVACENRRVFILDKKAESNLRKMPNRDLSDLISLTSLEEKNNINT